MPFSNASLILSPVFSQKVTNFSRAVSLKTVQFQEITLSFKCLPNPEITPKKPPRPELEIFSPILRRSVAHFLKLSRLSSGNLNLPKKSLILPKAFTNPSIIPDTSLVLRIRFAKSSRVFPIVASLSIKGPALKFEILSEILSTESLIFSEASATHSATVLKNSVSLNCLIHSATLLTIKSVRVLTIVSTLSLNLTMASPILAVISRALNPNSFKSFVTIFAANFKGPERTVATTSMAANTPLNVLRILSPVSVNLPVSLSTILILDVNL